MSIFNQLKLKGRIQSGRKSHVRTGLLRLEHLEKREMLSATPIPLESVLPELSCVVVTDAQSGVVSDAEYTCKDLKTFLAAQESADADIEFGATLSVVVEDIPSDVTVEYQWYRDDEAILGANDATYNTTILDVGCSLEVRATGVGDYEGVVSSVERVVVVPQDKDDPFTINANFDELKKALELVPDGGKISIKSDVQGAQTIELDSTLVINKNVTIDAGGNVFDGSAVSSNKDVDASKALRTSEDPKKKDYDGVRLTVEVGTSLEIVNGVFKNCSTNGDGGAIYNAGELFLIDVQVLNNEAGGCGGGIYCAEGSILTLDNVEFRDNRACSVDSNGGAVYLESGAAIGGMYNVTMSGNYAGKNGGAIYNGADNECEITGKVIIEDNTAGRNGGAIVNYGTMTITADSDSKISGNQAYRFGGAYFGCGDFTVEGSESTDEEDYGLYISGNTVGYATDDGRVEYYSGAKGGAIYNDTYGGLEGSVTIKGSVLFLNNAATERGGAIQTYSNLTIDGNVAFEGNEALKYGGAIDVGKNGSANLSGKLTFESNQASGVDDVDGFGGAIFSVSSLTFNSCSSYLDSDSSYTFTDNFAESSGGAIDICSGNATLAGSFTFGSNKANGPHGDDATGLGGALAIAGSVTMDSPSFSWDSGNSADRGKCVAIDTNISNLTPGDFGLELGDDYSTFTVIRKTVSKENALTPSAIAAEAVSMSLTLGDRTTTVGTEGITPEELGISAGVYEAFVEYTDVDGVTSPVYSFVLTVDQTATLNVVERTIANGRGVQYIFDVVAENYATPSSWLINWGDGKTSCIEKLSSSVMAAHYYQDDGNFDVSLTLVFNDGTTKEFADFATQTIGENAETEARAKVFAEVAETGDLLEELDRGFGPFFLE